MEAFEQQLKSLFEECADCLDCRLGFDGLQELCDRLDLKHCSASLAEALLTNDHEQKGVTYAEFRDALIKLLGPGTEPQRAGGDSPSREVSPKYVFGKKKYGRRSRPDTSDCESKLVNGVEACSVNEQTSVKKRRTQDECDYPENTGAAEVEIVESSEEEMLIAAWAAVASPGGRLSREQLVQVFQGVGLQSGSDEAASSVFEKLELGDEGITLEALLTFIKGGASLCKDVRNQDFTDSIPTIEFTDASSGCISGSSLLELWESGGVTDGRAVLQSLGCRPSQQCDLSVLTSRLHGLLQAARDDRHSSLFRAGLLLQRTYICSLKGVVDQMSGENEKLKADVSEANHRSQLLAQEVDDHHSRLEAATARRVKALEQRHADRVRELTEQVKAEQEQLGQQNAHLEKRVAVLESEEVQLRAELQRLQGDNQQLQEEHQALIGQLTTLRTERDGLRRNVQELSLIQQKLHEMEELSKDRDVLALMERVTGLEGENRSLRDRNDELALQVEHLSSRLHAASIHKRPSPETSLNLTVDAAMGEVDALGMDQDVPSYTDVECFEALDDVMLTKSAQGQLSNMAAGQHPETSNQSSSEVCALKVKKALAEKVSAMSSSIGSEASSSVLQELDSILDSPDFRCECCQLQGTVETLSGDLAKLRDEDTKLRTRCKELEQSMEQLQEEYERTEDYWTSKLEEERTLFDAEQRQNDQKYSDLVSKIVEYEEMMKEEAEVKRRLEPIEEKDGLEKQVLEMEEEYSKLLAEKQLEIDRLQEECKSHPPCADAPVQTDLPPPKGGSDGNGHNHCRRSLTFSSGDRRRGSCCKVYRLQGEVRSLLEAKQAAQREVATLLAERNLLYKQVLSQRREDSCSASLSSKLLCAERRCRTLMATLRNQQLQTAELLRSTWQQHKREVEELRGVLAVTDGKLHQQTIQIQNQLSKMAAADVLVKDLFVENAHLLAALRKLEPVHHGHHSLSSH